jgi:hypothetical protein
VYEPGVGNGSAGGPEASLADASSKETRALPGSPMSERGYVEFWPAGVATSGWFLCASCSNTVIVRRVLPRCMLCGERLWERAQGTGASASTAV